MQSTIAELVPDCRDIAALTQRYEMTERAVLGRVYRDPFSVRGGVVSAALEVCVVVVGLAFAEAVEVVFPVQSLGEPREHFGGSRVWHVCGLR